jgi:asparagine synthase (glutamine-hydrolysing)
MLAPSVVDFGLSLPAGMKVSGGRGKVLLRQAFADLLPADVLSAPKRGFGVPLASWLRNEMRDVLADTVLDPAVDRHGMLDRQAMEGLVNDHLAGIDDHSHRLWALMVLCRWLIG